MDELAPLTSALVDAVARSALQLVVAAGGRLSPRLLLARGIRASRLFLTPIRLEDPQHDLPARPPILATSG